MQTYARHATAVLVLSLIAASCSSPGKDEAAAPAGGRGGRAGRGGGPVPVVTAQAVRKDMPVTVPAVGTVEAMSSVDIRSQVTGQLTAIHFTEGQDVQQGEPLFSLDSRQLKTSLLQAQASLARDTATLRNLEGQQARNETLYKRGLISKDQFESQQASVAAISATVEADKAAIETARLNLAYTEIAAPTSGRTGSLGTHVGDLVRANDTTPLVEINQVAPIYVTFSVPGRFLGEIRRYQAQRPLAVVAATPDPASPDLSAASAATGVVSFIDNAVDASTGTIRLKATFANADRQLWPGSFVRVALNLTTQGGAIVVPATAVQTSQEGQFVYVVKADKTVEMRKVTVERQQGDEVVIAQGIDAGDVVVTDGHLRLTPGARVTEPGAGGREGSGGREGAGGGDGRGPRGGGAATGRIR
jgi:membrane fusion protein, multidrug efflux system